MSSNSIGFKGVIINKSEVKALRDLELIIKKKLIYAEKIEDLTTPLGFSTDNKSVKELIMQKCNLEELPESVKYLKNLTRLDLKFNKFSSFPDSILKIRSLEFLNLSGNEITDISADLGNLISLQFLDLSNNRIITLPESIGNLENLQSLDLKGNRLKLLPETIGNLLSLKELKVGHFLMKANQIKSLPESLFKLVSLEKLELNGLQLEAIPDSISQLQSLTSLRLDKNKLKVFPECITKLKSLKQLDISSNNFEIVPDSIGNLQSLEYLSIGSKSLKNLPETIGNLSSLKVLFMPDSQLKRLPQSIKNLQSLEEINLGYNIEKVKMLLKSIDLQNYKINQDGRVKIYPKKEMELDKLKPEIKFIPIELDYRIIKICEYLLKLLDVLQPDFNKELSEIKHSNINYFLHITQELASKLRNSDLIDDSIYVSLQHIKKLTDVEQIILKIEEIWKINKNRSRIKRIELYSENNEFENIWDHNAMKIILPYEEIFIIPNTEVTDFSDFPHGSLNQPRSKYTFTLENPRQLYIKRELGIRATDLEEVFINILPDYGDFHFYESLSYLWDYNGVPVYYLFIGS